MQLVTKFVLIVISKLNYNRLGLFDGRHGVSNTLARHHGRQSHVNVFRPETGSPIATNVLLVVVVLLGVFCYQICDLLRLFISQPIVAKLRIHIGDNIIHNRTVADFQVKS